MGDITIFVVLLIVRAFHQGPVCFTYLGHIALDIIACWIIQELKLLELEELEEVVHEKQVWASMFGLLPLRPIPVEEDGCVEFRGIC